MKEDDRQVERDQMVAVQLRHRGITDERVLGAMTRVPRHELVPVEFRDRAYEDSPLPIGEAQTISQPYIVALMTEMLGVSDRHRVLEVGTGSGYQAAVLAELAHEVFTIEVIESLFTSARENLRRLGYTNVHCRLGDGAAGWPEFAPFDRIVVTACAREAPSKLVDQLAVGGRMVILIGDPSGEQVLCQVTRHEDSEMDIEEGVPVRFVPMQ